MARQLLRWKQVLRGEAGRFLRAGRWLKPFRIDRCVEVEEVLGHSIENYRILQPAEARVPLGTNVRDLEFLRICKYFNDGSYSRPNVFVCEIPGAYCHIGTGLVCTSDFSAITDSVMEYRTRFCDPVGWFKPLRVRRLRGNYATINNVWGHNWWHWLVDCLPRIYSLYLAYPGQKVTLLMPKMNGNFEDSLHCALPPNFEVQYLPPNSWVQVDRMLFPFYVSARANGHLTGGYYDFIRQNVFAKLGLPAANRLEERIYVSRASARYRRILNEDQLVEMLARYGFRSAATERLTFQEEVKLFHRAAVVVSAYGSAWANTLFSGRIKMLVLYPTALPSTGVFTMAKALEQDHFFLAGTRRKGKADFAVDVAEAERLLRDTMGIGPVASRLSSLGHSY